MKVGPFGVAQQIGDSLRARDVLGLSRPTARELLRGHVAEEARALLAQFRVGDVLGDEWRARNDMLREIEKLVRAPDIRYVCGQVADIAAQFRREQALTAEVLRESKLALSQNRVVADVAAMLRPLEAMRDTWDMPDVLKDVLGSMKTADALLRAHGPILTPHSAAAIAALWGEEGFRRQLRALGIADFDLSDGASESEAGLRIPAPDFWTVVSLILSVLFWLLPEWKAAREKAELEGSLDGLQKIQLRQEQQLDAIEHLLHQALAQKRTGNICYVTRERSAKVRESLEPGARVIATVFPNQVVTLIERRGKWILVEYYDWLSQETMTGWVLKKYLQRMPSC